jgi:hypothetical protein
MYGKPDLSTDMYLSLTRAVMNLCTEYYCTFQTCAPHQCGDETANSVGGCGASASNSDGGRTSMFGGTTSSSSSRRSNSKSLHVAIEEEDGTMKQPCMETALLRSKMIGSISIQIISNTEQSSQKCLLVDVLGWLSRPPTNKERQLWSTDAHNNTNKIKKKKKRRKDLPYPQYLRRAATESPLLRRMAVISFCLLCGDDRSNALLARPLANNHNSSTNMALHHHHHHHHHNSTNDEASSEEESSSDDDDDDDEEQEQEGSERGKGGGGVLSIDSESSGESSEEEGEHLHAKPFNIDNLTKNKKNSTANDTKTTDIDGNNNPDTTGNHSRTENSDGNDNNDDDSTSNHRQHHTTIYRRQSMTLTEEIHSIHSTNHSIHELHDLSIGLDLDAPLQPPLIDIEIALDQAAKSYVAIIHLHHDHVPKQGWKAEFNTEKGVMIVFTINGEAPLWELCNQKQNHTENNQLLENDHDGGSGGNGDDTVQRKKSVMETMAARERKGARIRSSMLASLAVRNQGGKAAPTLIYGTSESEKV